SCVDGRTTERSGAGSTSDPRKETRPRLPGLPKDGAGLGSLGNRDTRGFRSVCVRAEDLLAITSDHGIPGCAVHRGLEGFDGAVAEGKLGRTRMKRAGIAAL